MTWYAAHSEEEFNKWMNHILTGNRVASIHIESGHVVVSTREFTTILRNNLNFKNNKLFREFIEGTEFAKVCVNGKETYKYFKSMGITMERILCLEMGQHCLKGGLWTSVDFYLNKMAEQFKVELPQLSEEKHQHAIDTNMAEVSRLTYNVGSCMYTKIQQFGLMKVWMIENDCVPVYGDMEFYGQVIDRAAWEALIEANQRDLSIAKAKLDQFFAPILNCDEDGKPIINYNSSAQVLDALKRLSIRVDGKLIDATNKNVLKKLMHLPPIQALKAYRSAEDRLSNFGQKYLDAADKDGRIYPQFNQYAASTGRPGSTGGINFLNIPRDTSFRSAFIAGYGRLLSSVDYSGSDLRVIANQSKDENFLKVFKSGEDIHCYSSSILYGKQILKNDPLRKPGKALNLGIAFGKTAETLQEDLNFDGFPISLQETESLLKKYKNHFRQATQYLEMKAKQVAANNFVLRNMNGRMRVWEIPEGWYPGKPAPSHVQREAMNFEPQSVSIDFAKVAMATMRKEYKRRNLDAYIYNCVFDEIIVSAREDVAETAHNIQKAVMIMSAEDMLTNVPMQVEGFISPRWA